MDGHLKYLGKLENLNKNKNLPNLVYIGELNLFQEFIFTET
jgi:hypothetical protein